MIYLVVGKNGSGKSYVCVRDTKDFHDQNIVNLKKNSESYSKNYEFLVDRDYNKLFEEFTSNIDQLKIDNPKVYASYKISTDLLSDFHFFSNIQDSIDFDDYFRFHIIYNDFIKFVSKSFDFDFELLKPVHQLFSDINGIRIDTVKYPPKDWRTAPLGSKIYYDEFQDRPEFLFDGNKPSKNPMIIELSKIRHYDIDLYLITPDSENLHKSLRKIVHVMYFIKRPHGNPDCCSLYIFDQFLANPRAAADSTREPKKYSGYELIKYKKSIQNLYVSAANHSSMKFQIPWKWIRNAVLIILGFMIIISMLFKIPIFSFFAEAVKGMFGHDNNVAKLKDPMSNMKPKQQQSQQTTAQPGQTNLDLSQECRKAVNVDKAECVKWLDELSKNNGSVTTGENGQAIVTYDPSHPYADSFKNVTYEVTAKPVFSGCTKFGSRYQAYTQQGTKLDVSQSDCERLIKNNDRPFNYFAQNLNSQQQAPVAQVQNQNLSDNVLAQSQTHNSIDSKQLELMSDSNQANNVIVETRTLSYSKDIHHIN
jgi:hypothetical protein